VFVASAAGPVGSQGLPLFLPSRVFGYRLEAVRTRQQPIAPAAVAHRSGRACIVSRSALKLGRPLTRDAKAESFLHDAEANALLSRPERAPCGVLRSAKQRPGKA
jgi:hypothetical protein